MKNALILHDAGNDLSRNWLKLQLTKKGLEYNATRHKKHRDFISSDNKKFPLPLKLI
jgi:hypothetical protein